MKVIFVVDSITDLMQKVDTVRTRFGNDITFSVRAELVDIFKTYNLPVGAIYKENLSLAIHGLLVGKQHTDGVVIYYASMKLSDELLNRFVAYVGDRQKVVTVQPKYNACERGFNSLYNIYVKNMFKMRDGMASPKLQYLPAPAVEELLSSHIANKMFELPPTLVRAVECEDKEINKTIKVRPNFTKSILLSAIVALVITLLMITSFAFIGFNFLIIFACLLGYVLDILITLMWQFKKYFDHRFLK